MHETCSVSQGRGIRVQERIGENVKGCVRDATQVGKGAVRVRMCARGAAQVREGT